MLSLEYARFGGSYGAFLHHHRGITSIQRSSAEAPYDSDKGCSHPPALRIRTPVRYHLSAYPDFGTTDRQAVLTDDNESVLLNESRLEMKKQHLNLEETLHFDVDGQFRFEKTFYRPSEFPAGLDLYDKNQPSYYQALNLGDVTLGLKYTMSDGRLCLNVYSEKKLEPDTLIEAEKEIRFRLSLDRCDSAFYYQFADDRFVGEIIKKNRGRLKFVKYSLYENLMVSVFLQNATVQRTISMCHNMLSRYGTLLCFDKIEIFAMWRPEDLRATDEELREQKVGYRAKNILRITEHFVNDNVSESALRKLPTDKLEKELLKIYGVGKQTVFYVMGRAEYLKHISLWERRILSRYIFDEELCEEKYLVNWFHEHYHQWCGLAFSLIFEDIFFQHRAKPLPWLKKILRQD